MFSSLFWRDALERSVSTAAEAFGSAATVGAVSTVVFNVTTFGWKNALGVAAGAAVLSLAKSLAALKVKGTLSPASLVPPPAKF